MSGTSRGPLYDAFGAYVRSQRQLARLTLRQAAEMARISNPYLSQIEHGLALPSITVLTALADALSVSAEAMLAQAAGVTSASNTQGARDTEDAIRQDSRLDDGQKRALLAVLNSFVCPGSQPGGESPRPTQRHVVTRSVGPQPNGATSPPPEGHDHA